jgi:hypothetical protein
MHPVMSRGLRAGVEMRSLRIVPLLILLTTFSALAQNTGNAASADIEKSPAKVYVYRYKQFVGGALAPSVYCDDVQLARMDNGRYFMAMIPAGKHSFRSNDAQFGMDLNLKSGQEYFLRVEIATGFMKGRGRLVLMPREQASYELRTAKLKPLDPAKVADKTRVSVAEVHLIDTPPPAVEAVTPAPAAKLMTVSATESTVSGVSIQRADDAVEPGSKTGDQTSVGEPARRNKRPQPTR